MKQFISTILRSLRTLQRVSWDDFMLAWDELDNSYALVLHGKSAHYLTGHGFHATVHGLR